MNRFLAFAIAIAGLCSCRATPDARRSLALEFLVESDPGVPLAATQISVDGQRLGQSDERGSLRATVQMVPKAALRIEHDCPDGYLGPNETKSMRVRDYQGVAGAGSPPMQVSLRCRPEKRLAVFVVRARNGANLPVLLNGEPVAQTNAGGIAHFSAFDLPGAEYVVKLDTVERARLLPQSPTHTFELPDANELFVVDQSFELAKMPRRSRFRRKRILKIE